MRQSYCRRPLTLCRIRRMRATTIRIAKRSLRRSGSSPDYPPTPATTNEDCMTAPTQTQADANAIEFARSPGGSGRMPRAQRIELIRKLRRVYIQSRWTDRVLQKFDQLTDIGRASCRERLCKTG